MSIADRQADEAHLACVSLPELKGKSEIMVVLAIPTVMSAVNAQAKLES